MLVLASASPRRKEILETCGLNFELEVASLDESVIFDYFRKRSDFDPAGLVEALAKAKAEEVLKRRPHDLILGADTIVVLEDDSADTKPDQSIRKCQEDKSQDHKPVEQDESKPAFANASNAVAILQSRFAFNQNKPSQKTQVEGKSNTDPYEQILGKPQSPQEAVLMLERLSGKKHKVYTGVALISAEHKLIFHDLAQVEFNPLDEFQKALIDYYAYSGKALDKAGSYGIQDEGGALVKSIHGDFFTVMGLPLSKTRRALYSLGYGFKNY